MPAYDFRFTAMGSACALCLEADDAAAAQGLARMAIAEIERIEHKYSRYRSDSLLCRINGAAGRAPQTIDAETSGLFDYADTLYRNSRQKFDPTSGVLRRAWDFRQARLPDPALLRACLALVGWERVERDAGQVFLPQAGMELDFGGIGKEYAADRAATVLLQQGVGSGVINLGGDVRVLGPRADGSAWQLGVQDPRRAGHCIAQLPMLRGALATSGDYERYFELDGRRYCHVLDPHSGYPVEHWRSVSVLAPVATAAGSYASIALLLQHDALAWLRETGLGFLAIDRHGEVFRQGSAD